MPRETVLEREDQTSIPIISDRIVGAAPRRAEVGPNRHRRHSLHELGD